MNIILLAFQFMLILTQLNQLLTKVNFCYLCNAWRDQTCTRDLKKESIMNCTGTKTTDACMAILYHDGTVTRGCDRDCRHETKGSDHTVLCCYTDFCNDDVFTSTSTPTSTTKPTTTPTPTSISNTTLISTRTPISTTTTISTAPISNTTSKQKSESILTAISNFKLIFIFVLISIKFRE